MRYAVLILASAILLAGCGQRTIRQDGAQKAVAQIVNQQTGFNPTDVKCPSGVEAKVGNAFDCHFTGPEPKPYTAHVKITAVQGSKVHFFIDAKPSK